MPPSAPSDSPAAARTEWSGGLTAAEVAVLDGVDDRALVASLAELVAVPSIGGTAAEVDIQHRLADELAAAGLDVDLWPLDLAELTDAPGFLGVEVDRHEAWGLVGASRPGERPALVLQGHVDVVPPGDLAAWPAAPFRPVVTDDAVYGRGACDMKAGVAAILGAVRAVRRSGIELDRPFGVHFAVGEEDGGLGAFATLARGYGGDACIIAEPTGNELVTANAGALTFRIEVPGLATHGSTAYVGSSAITSYLAIHQALAELERRRNLHTEPLMRALPVAYPLSVGRVRAGDWASTVPDLLVAEGRYGTRIEEDPVAARAELEDAVQQAARRDPYLRDHPPTVSWPGGQFGGGHLAAGHGLRDLISVAHGDVSGQPLGNERGAPYGSDLRLYTGDGIPTLHYGPGDIRLAHAPGESVPIAELLTATRVLTLALLRACR